MALTETAVRSILDQSYGRFTTGLRELLASSSLSGTALTPPDHGLLAREIVALATGAGDQKKLPKYWIVKGLDPDGSGWFVGTCIRPDKYSDVVEKGLYIPQDRVQMLWDVICAKEPRVFCQAKTPSEVPADAKFGLPSLVEPLIARYSLPVAPEAFNGGRLNRETYYFPFYLWPMRILDHMGLIRFGYTSWRLS